MLAATLIEQTVVEAGECCQSVDDEDDRVWSGHSPGRDAGTTAAVMHCRQCQASLWTTAVLR